MKPIRLLRFLLLCSLAALLVNVQPSRGADRIAAIKDRARQYYYGQGVPQDYKQALDLYLMAANAGDAQAQYIAGGMYFKGLGTKVDYAKALALLYKAAKNGSSTAESQKIIGQSFLLGRDVPKNYLEAVHWYGMAAKSGDRDAQNELGYMYFVGRGIEQDYHKAYQLFLQAAESGLPIAQYNVGTMLYFGYGEKNSDLPGAYAWFSLAAAQGYAPAQQMQQFVESLLSSEELVQAQARAASLFNRILGLKNSKH